MKEKRRACPLCGKTGMKQCREFSSHLASRHRILIGRRELSRMGHQAVETRMARLVLEQGTDAFRTEPAVLLTVTSSGSGIVSYTDLASSP